MADENFDDQTSAPETAARPEGSPAPDAPADQAETPTNDTPTDEALSRAVEDALAQAVAQGRERGDLPAYKWLAANYTYTGNSGPAADKLADSAVAPIVAAARGYETVEEDTLADATKRFNLPRKNMAQGKRIANAVARGDLLIMPWFTASDLAYAARTDNDPVPTTIQFRPSRPEVEIDSKGRERERKYEFVGGGKTPVAVHPSFTNDWIDSAPTVLIAEGLLKGDSALTGYLLANGATPSDLAWYGGSRRAAQQRLTELLDAIPVEDRIVMFTIGGVDNWKNNAEWRDLEFKGRQVWLGIDGDVSSNPHVYRAANELWHYLTEKKKAKVSLIAPTVQASDGEKKVGIDDYLSKYGPWNALLDQRADTMPDAPDTANLEALNTYRISEDGTAFELCKPTPNPFDPDAPPIDGHWVVELPLGGRILSTVAQRVPSPHEIRTGKIDNGANSDADTYCEIEIKWATEAGDVEIGVVSGPAEILNYPPDQWVRQRARIPANVLRNPNWPPPKKSGEDWLKALKAHRADEILDRTRWDAMGWVPVEGDVPAFVVGDQVIGGEENPDVDIFPGITEVELAGANRFGVGDIDLGKFDDPAYLARVKADIELVLDTFLLSGAFTDRRVASTLLAGALRPAVPVRPHATMFLVGPPGRGKSWAAGLTMGFWSRHPGSFTGSSLPGAAKDTAASLELSVARAPIWVVDDLAPASSRQQSEQEQNKIGDLIRNVFNGAGKRRSTADMGSRKVHMPRSLLIVTAENDIQVASIRDRVVTLNIGHGALSPSQAPTNLLDELCEENGAPARVTQALIRHLRHRAKTSPGGWVDLYAATEEDVNRTRNAASDWMKENTPQAGSTKRVADLAADLAVSLIALVRLAEHVGVRDEYLDLFTNDGIIGDVYSLAASGHQTNKETTTGRSLLLAVRAALFEKSAHILDAADPASVPGGPMMGPHLGWQVSADGNSSPRGVSIGWLVTEKDSQEQYVYLDQRAAFSAAQKTHPELISHGQGQRTAWAAFVGEELAVNELLRPKDGSGKRLNTARKRLANTTSISGVPVSLSTLIDSVPPETEAEAATTE